MTRFEVVQHIKDNYIEGKDFTISEHCETCLDVYNNDIMNDPVVLQHLKNN